MVLTKEAKEEQVKDLINHLESDKAIVLVNYQGLKMKDLQDLRNQLFEEGESLKIIKNTLLKIALKKKSKSVEEDLLDQPIALVFSSEDEINPSKILYNFTKDNENLKILGAFLDGNFVGQDVILSLGQLPDREELYAKLIGSINAPIYNFVKLLKVNLFRIVSILKQYERSING